MVLVATVFYQKNTQNSDQKVNQRQNTVCLEQQIYASPENFTPTLLEVLETFRRSGVGLRTGSENSYNLNWISTRIRVAKELSHNSSLLFWLSFFSDGQFVTPSLLHKAKLIETIGQNNWKKQGLVLLGSRHPLETCPK